MVKTQISDLIPDFGLDPLKRSNRRSKIKKALENQGLLRWCLQESNQGHMDFQSIALPTELRHQTL